MPGKASISLLSLLLLAMAGLMAQQPVSRSHSSPEKEGTGVTRAALKGCLSATAAGAYRLADDETGAVYNLVGSRETLRMLVGTDVLVTGQNLQTSQSPSQDQSQDQSNDPDGANQIEHRAAPHSAGGEASGANSFRVINAIKIADVCFLSTSESAILLPQ